MFAVTVPPPRDDTTVRWYCAGGTAVRGALWVVEALVGRGGTVRRVQYGGAPRGGDAAWRRGGMARWHPEGVRRCGATAVRCGGSAVRWCGVIRRRDGAAGAVGGGSTAGGST